MRSYAQHVEDHLIPHLGSIRLGELTGRQVAEMFTALAATPNHRGALPAASTLHRIRATLRSALNSALREGLIAHNPARYVELATPRRQYAQVWTGSRVREWDKTGQRYPAAVWTASLLAQFLRSVEQDRLNALWWLIALRGLRRGEAAGLRWADVDLDERTVTISQQRIVCGRKILVGPPKTAASRRVVALDSVTVRDQSRERSTGSKRPGGAVEQVSGSAVGLALPDSSRVLSFRQGAITAHQRAAARTADQRGGWDDRDHHSQPV